MATGRLLWEIAIQVLITAATPDPNTITFLTLPNPSFSSSLSPAFYPLPHRQPHSHARPLFTKCRQFGRVYQTPLQLSVIALYGCASVELALLRRD